MAVATSGQEISVYQQIIELASQYETYGEFIGQYPNIADYLTQQQLTDFLYYWALRGAGDIQPSFTEVVNGSEHLISGFAAAVQPAVNEAADYVDDAAIAYENYVASGAPPVGPPPPVYTFGAGAVATSLGYKLCQVLSVAAPYLMCGMAALMGYDLGTKVYEEDPDFWEGVFQTIAPWSFDAIDKFIGVEYNGRTYADSRIYNAVKHYLESNLIPGFIVNDAYENQVLRMFMEDNNIVELKYNYGTSSSTEITYNGKTFNVSDVTMSYNGATGTVLHPYVRESYTYQTTGIFVYRLLHPNGKFSRGILSASPAGVYTSTSGFYRLIQNETYYNNYSDYENDINGEHHHYDSKIAMIELYTRNDKTVAWRLSKASATAPDGDYGEEYGPILSQNLNTALCNEIAWNMVYGNTSTTEGANGVSHWQGDTVSDPYSGSIDVLVDSTTGQTVTFIPFSIPSADAERLNPTTNPNPQQYSDGATQVQPYALTDALPFPQTTPQPDVTSDPDTNPSSQPETQPSTQVPTSPKPGDSGQSPANPPNPTPPVFNPGSSAPSGLINVYNPTPQQLYDFGNWLWVTYNDITIQKILNNPFDGVISLHEIYATPDRGAVQQIRSGFLNSGVSSITVPNRYTYINCGSIVIPEWYGNYLDYSPYTKAFLYLPFIGIEEVDADDIVGSAVNVTYGVDSYSGACVAIVTTAREGYNAVTYQFTGNCSVEHPITGGTQAQNLIAILQGTLGIASSYITSNFNGMVNSAFDFTKSKSTVSHSGKFGANFGAMAIKKPYIIVKRPNQVVVPNYNEFYGYPAHKYVKIGSCSGYIRCREVHVNSARATDEEKQRIESLLKEGVYVN